MTGQAYFDALLDTRAVMRQSGLWNRRSMNVSDSNDWLSSGDGRDVVFGDNAAMVTAFGSVAWAPSNGLLPPYFRSGLAANLR